MILRIYFFDKFFRTRNERAILKFEHYVYRLLINVSDGSDRLLRRSIDKGIADECGVTEFRILVLLGKSAWEEHVATGEFAGTLLRIDVAELNQHDLIALESVLFHEERHEDSVNGQHEILGIHAVEDIVIDLHRELALYAMGLPYPTNLIYFLFFYHSYNITLSLILNPHAKAIYLSSPPLGEVGRGFLRAGERLLLSRYLCTKRIKTCLDVLIATVYLRNVIDTRHAIGRQSCDKQRNSGTNVRT